MKYTLGPMWELLCHTKKRKNDILVTIINKFFKVRITIRI